MPQDTVTVYFDYVCPYAWRGAELAELVAEPLGLRFDWRHFSLYQVNATGADGWQLWNDRIDPCDDAGSKGLLPFLASIAAGRQAGGAHHDAFRLALLRMRHREHRSLNRDTMLAAAAEAGLQLPCFESDLDDPEARTRLARDHQEGVSLHVFGTPTFRFPSGDIAYVRLREVPAEPDEAVTLFRDVRGLLEQQPYLETVKRPRPRGN